MCHLHSVSLHSSIELLSILCASNHLSQFIFASEVGLEDVEILDEVARSRENSLLRGDLAVGLDSKFKFGEEGMRDLKVCQRNTPCDTPLILTR